MLRELTQDEADLADLAIADTRQRERERRSDNWAAKRQAILDECFPHQLQATLDTHRRISLIIPRGGGKTTCIRARYLLRMGGTMRARCIYFLLTREQAVDIMWEPLKEACSRLEIPATFNETKLRCVFTRTGSWLRLVGADDKKQIEKFRGQPFHEAWIDEAASFPPQLVEHLIDRVVGPRSGEVGGMIGMVGTPGHILSGPFYEATMPGLLDANGKPYHRPFNEREKPEYEGWDRWSSHHWSLDDGAPHVKAIRLNLEEQLKTKAANGWSDRHPVYLRECKGIWAADDTDHIYKYRPHDEDGKPLNQWDPEREENGFAKLPEDIKDPVFVYGMDLGAKDPFALEVFAYSPFDTQKRLFHVWEYVSPNMYSRKIAELLLGDELSHDSPTGVIAKTGWPEAIVADLAGLGEALIAELGEVYGIPVTAADKKSKFGNIELFNGDLIDGRLYILKGSVLEQQLQQLQWTKNDFGERKEHRGQRNDAADAAIYARRAAQHLLAEEAPQPQPVFKPLPDPTKIPWPKDEPEESVFEIGLFDEPLFDEW